MNDKLRELACASYALEIGKAAEHLVCADLILSGYRAYLSDQGLPYDLVIDKKGDLIRVQVKATCFPTNVNKNGERARIAYGWRVTRRGKDGKGERLSSSDCDVIALVALDCRCVAYLPLAVCGQTIQLSPPGKEIKTRFRSGSQWARDVSQFPIEEALAGDLGVYKSAKRSLTHCLHGHEYTDENTYKAPSGYRSCRECLRISRRGLS